MIDSHAHLDYDSFDADRDAVVARAFDAGIELILNICLGPEPGKFARSLAMAKLDARIFSAVGVHPHDADKMTPAIRAYLDDAIRADDRIRVVGEIGLDYHYDHSDRARQREVFADLIDLALAHRRPVAIHTREAFDDTRAILAEKDVCRRTGGIIHCFSATRPEAEAYLDLGAHISFSGIVTFKKAEAVREAARIVPLDRLLIETDCPYLAPEPYRGQRNEPAYVRHVADTLAALHGTTAAEIGAHARRNLRRLLFGETPA